MTVFPFHGLIQIPLTHVHEDARIGGNVSARSHQRRSYLFPHDLMGASVFPFKLLANIQYLSASWAGSGGMAADWEEFSSHVASCTLCFLFFFPRAGTIPAGVLASAAHKGWERVEVAGMYTIRTHADTQ